MIAIKHNGVFVGNVIGKVFITEKRPEHYFRIFQGFGESVRVLEDAVCAGASDLKMIYHGVKGDVIYRTSIRTYMLEGKDYTNPLDPNDRQKVLSESKFTVERPGDYDEVEEL